MRNAAVGIAAAIFALAAASIAQAQSAADFYRGKTVELYIGYSVGGGYDVYARMLARHIGKHIPGIGLNQVYEQNSVPQFPQVKAAMEAVATEAA